MNNDYVAGLKRAVEIVKAENERRLALASIRIPALASEITLAIRNEIFALTLKHGLTGADSRNGVDNLAWYAEKAEALKRYSEAKNYIAMEAVMTELILDGGRRGK